MRIGNVKSFKTIQPRIVINKRSYIYIILKRLTFGIMLNHHRICKFNQNAKSFPKINPGGVFHIIFEHISKGIKMI